MKILIFYFSGTGNTEKIAKLYRDAFAAHGDEVTLASIPDYIQNGNTLHIEDFDMLGFGYPIHAFNAPENVLDFAKTLPALPQEKKGFIFKSSGEPVRMSDVSSLKLVKILKKRNIIVQNEYQYCMPYNIIFRHSDEMAYRMWTTAQALVPADVQEIVDGIFSRPKKIFMGGTLAGVMRVEHGGAHLIGKGFKTTDKCVQCGLCVKTCPAHNIVQKDGKIKFGSHCLICMRCVFSCPKDAIKPSILKGWKVNGAYSFAPPDPNAPPQDDKHADYCAKAYARYFAAAQEKIQAYKNGAQ